MARRESYDNGTFCAVDLVTPDVEGAAAFYGALLGWDAVASEQHAYTGFHVDGAKVAGAIALTEEMQAAGAPPAWTTYVRVESLDGTALKAESLGGRALGTPLEIPGIGRTVPLADPQGAVLLAWEPAGWEGEERVNEVGTWVWNDLQTPEPEGVLSFYSELLGWSIEPIEASHGMYWSVSNNGRGIGGIMRSPQTPKPFWNAYFGVADIDATLQQAASLGATTLLEPITVPAGRFAMSVDPQGALVSFIEGEYDE
ncbi:VOC family protein [Conexibacter woesei]|uniref:VOC family protein n=1 Tax=Conexibacter woesei TaxID=191495 RepID=UPI0004293412|nr:VOC family protein [Conexibacter woesei]